MVPAQSSISRSQGISSGQLGEFGIKQLVRPRARTSLGRRPSMIRSGFAARFGDRHGRIDPSEMP